MTEFGSYSYDGVSAAKKGPTHRGPKSGGGLVTLFGSFSYDGVSAAIRGPTHRGEAGSG